MPAILLWLLGIPIPIIILLLIFHVLLGRDLVSKGDPKNPSWHAKACHPRLASSRKRRRGCSAFAEHDVLARLISRMRQPVLDQPTRDAVAARQLETMLLG